MSQLRLRVASLTLKELTRALCDVATVITAGADPAYVVAEPPPSVRALFQEVEPDPLGYNAERHAQGETDVTAGHTSPLAEVMQRLRSLPLSGGNQPGNPIPEPTPSAESAAPPKRAQVYRDKATARLYHATRMVDALPGSPECTAAVEELSMVREAVHDLLDERDVETAEIATLRATVERLKGENEAARNGLAYWERIKEENAALRAELVSVDRILSGRPPLAGSPLRLAKIEKACITAVRAINDLATLRAQVERLTTEDRHLKEMVTMLRLDVTTAQEFAAGERVERSNAESILADVDRDRR